MITGTTRFVPHIMILGQQLTTTTVQMVVTTMTKQLTDITGVAEETITTMVKVMTGIATVLATTTTDHISIVGMMTVTTIQMGQVNVMTHILMDGLNTTTGITRAVGKITPGMMHHIHMFTIIIARTAVTTMTTIMSVMDMFTTTVDTMIIGVTTVTTTTITEITSTVTTMDVTTIMMDRHLV